MKHKLTALLTAAMMLASSGTILPVQAEDDSYMDSVIGTLPDWTPMNFIDAMEFYNKYGKTHVEDNFICLVKPMRLDEKENIRVQTREKYGVKKDDFLLVTGGKIDRDKNVHLLVEAISAIDDKRLRLMIFGNISPEVESIIDGFGDDRVIKVGWIPSNRVYDFMYAADLVVFTGLHSVMWEQAVAARVPCLFSKLKGFEHIDIGGNALFFENRSV